MPEEIKITRTSLILYGLAVLVVAFLGVMMGSWVIGKRQAGAYERWTSAGRSSPMAFKKGDRFPSIDLIDLEGKPINTALLISGHKTVIITLSPGCEPCASMVNEWNQYADKIPPDLKIIGITNLGAGQALAYRNETGFPFQIYCDTAHVLSAVYGLEAFPTMVGLDMAGRVSFVGEGWLDGFTPLDAYREITERE
jgi:peroxiredoxin